MISVVIPLYNKEDSIYDTIKSVLGQTFIDFEIVVINDGSTDNSISVIASNYIDKRIRIIDQRNAGVSAARNRGVKESRGEWIVFLDADDILLPTALEILADLQEKYKTDVVSANYFRRHADGSNRLYRKGKYEGLIKNNMFSYYMERISLRMGCAMFSRNSIINNNFPEHLSRYEDMSWILTICRNCSIVVTAEPILIYTIENRGLSNFSLSKLELDYTYHLNFKKKSFWERMIYAKIILSNLYSGVPLKNYINKYGLISIIFITIVFIHSKIKRITQLYH